MFFYFIVVNCNLKKINKIRIFITFQEKMLNNLEKNAEEREVYWKGVVDVKNNEIENLKSNSSQVSD